MVERGFAWLHAFNRLRTRWEHRTDIHPGLLHRLRPASASASQVKVRVDDGVLRLAVTDDGVGGADPAADPACATAWRRWRARWASAARLARTLVLVQMPLLAERVAEAGGQPQS